MDSLDSQSTLVFPRNGRCHLSHVLLVRILGRIVRYQLQKCVWVFFEEDIRSQQSVLILSAFIDT